MAKNDDVQQMYDGVPSCFIVFLFFGIIFLRFFSFFVVFIVCSAVCRHFVRLAALVALCCVSFPLSPLSLSFLIFNLLQSATRPEIDACSVAS